MADRKTGRAYLQLHTAVFLFGFTGILGKLISLEATMLVWHRLWMTSVMMFAFVYFTGKWKRLPGKEVVKIVAISGAITLHWVLFYASIKYTSVSVAMICLSSITFFTALLEPIILRKRLSAIQLLFSALVIAGVYLMANGQRDQFNGIMIGLASAFFSALFTVLNKKILHNYDSRVLSLYEIMSGSILLTLMLPLINQFLPLHQLMPTQDDWIYLFMLSFFCTVVAFNLSMSSLRHLSPFTVNLTINLEPVYGILLAFVVFHEHKLLGPGFYMGSACILSAVLGEIAWKTYKSRRNSQNEATLLPP